MCIWYPSALGCTADPLPRYLFYSQSRWCDVPELRSWRPRASCRLWFEGSGGTSEKCPFLDPPDDRQVNTITVSIQPIINRSICPPLLVRYWTDALNKCLKLYKSPLAEGFKTSGLNETALPFSTNFHLSVTWMWLTGLKIFDGLYVCRQIQLQSAFH